MSHSEGTEKCANLLFVEQLCQLDPAVGYSEACPSPTPWGSGQHRSPSCKSYPLLSITITVALHYHWLPHTSCTSCACTITQLNAVFDKLTSHKVIIINRDCFAINKQLVKTFKRWQRQTSGAVVGFVYKAFGAYLVCWNMYSSSSRQRRHSARGAIDAWRFWE